MMKQEVVSDDGKSSEVQLIERMEMKREERDNYMLDNFMKIEDNTDQDWAVQKAKRGGLDGERREGSNAVVSSEEFKRFML